MKIQELLFPLLFLCAIPGVGSAQITRDTVFVITLNGDTVMGLTKWTEELGNPSDIEVKFPGKPETTFKPAEIKGFFLPSKQYYYSSQLVDIDVSPYTFTDLEVFGNKDTVVRQQVFLRLITLGKASLYSYIDSTNKPHFYLGFRDSIRELKVYYSIDQNNILTEGAKLMEQDAYKTQLMNALGDCPGISPKILNASYQEPSLNKIFIYYDSRGKDTIYSSFEKKSTLHFHPGILFGVATNTFVLSGNGYVGKETLARGLVSISGETVFSNKFSLFNDLRLLRYTISLSRPAASSSDPSSNGFLDTRYLMLAIIPRYHWPLTDNYIFFVEAGIELGFTNALFGDTENFYYSNPPTETQQTPWILNATFQTLLTAGAGIQIYRHLTLDLAMSTGTAPTNDGDYSSHVISWVIGVDFSL